MSGAALPFAMAGAALLAIGAYGFVTSRELLRQILAFNIIGGGIFLLFGAFGRDETGATDPVPQAMIITGIVVAFAATALAVALAMRLHEETGSGALPDGEDEEGNEVKEECAGGECQDG